MKVLWKAKNGVRFLVITKSLKLNGKHLKNHESHGLVKFVLIQSLEDHKTLEFDDSRTIATSLLPITYSHNIYARTLIFRMHAGFHSFIGNVCLRLPALSTCVIVQLSGNDASCQSVSLWLIFFSTQQFMQYSILLRFWRATTCPSVDKYTGNHYLCKTKQKKKKPKLRW